MDFFRIYDSPRWSDPLPWFGSSTPNKWQGYCPLLGTIQGIARLRFEDTGETIKSKALRIVRSAVEITGLGFVLLPIDLLVSAFVSKQESFKKPPSQQAAPSIGLFNFAANSFRAPPLSIIGNVDQARNWSEVCSTSLPTGGRRIINPGNLCYMNSALSALSACPSLLQRVHASAEVGNGIAGLLEHLLTELNNRAGPALSHIGNTAIGYLSRALVGDTNLRCPVPFTTYWQTHVATEALEYILRGAGILFERYESDGTVDEGSRIEVREDRIPTSVFTANLTAIQSSNYSLARPLGLEDLVVEGDIRGDIKLTVIGQPPAVLPICFDRITNTTGLHGEHQLEKNSLPVLPPLVLNVPVANSVESMSASIPVPYYLRSVMVHHGSANGGHYVTYVPRPGEIDERGFPVSWEIRNGISVRNVTADEALRDILTNGIGFIYEKGPAD